MSEMVERVARAIDSAIERAGGWDDGYCDSQTIARAAIEAMREPTHEMFLAGREMALSGKEDELMNRDSVKARWRFMIDAAISPKPSP